MPDAQISVPTWTPPGWLNALIALFLRTPLLQRLLGRSLALITVTGSKTGRRYTMPVTYARSAGTVTVLSKRFRRWWRNLAARPEVELRLAGRELRGRARATVGDPSALPALKAFLERRPRDARAYGIRVGADGTVGEADAGALLPQVVVIEIELV